MRACRRHFLNLLCLPPPGAAGAGDGRQQRRDNQNAKLNPDGRRACDQLFGNRRNAAETLDTPAESRNIVAARQLDYDRIVAAVGGVIIVQR